MWKSTLGIFVASLLLGLWWYSFVSGWYLTFNPEVQFITSAGDTLYIQEDSEAKTVLVYNSNFDISTASIKSLCDIESRYLDSYKNLYFFEVDFTRDMACNNGNVVLQLGEEIYGNTIHTLEVIQKNEVFWKYLDYGDDDLTDVLDQLEYDVNENAIFKNYNNVNIANNFRYYKWKNIYNNALFHSDMIQFILDGRKQKYLTPVLGRTFSSAATKLPNSGRPYRASYTDGIHYWFDIDGDLWDSAIALDYGIVVRVVDEFDNSDFSRIVYGSDLSKDQELWNLDILRWKQVWIKTLKWELVFYSHLNSVDENMVVWSLVEKWQLVWLTWATGVPEDWYDDFHLHFEVYKNPYDILKAWSYDYWDYIFWEYLWKWMNNAQLLQLISDTFE